MRQKPLISYAVPLCCGAIMSLMASVQAQGQQIDLRELTLDKIQADFTAGRYTSQQLTQAYLARIEKYQPYYNAFTFMNDKALAEAKAIDDRRAAGEKLGPLAGVPVVIKEAMDVAGFPSTAGWAKLSKKAGGVDLVPEKDAPVVARMRGAGAVILGKTNIPVYSDDAARANSSWAGPTFNAVDRSIVPGASSSGSATAVSGNLTVVGLAEETGGSIQNPASAQSLVGVKPTFGLVPNAGVVPLGGSTRDVVGPLARTVRDAALTLDVLAGYTADDPKTVAAIGNIPDGGYTSRLSDTALKGARIGLYGPGWRTAPLSDETKALYDAAVAELRARGAVLIEDPFAGTDFASLVMPNVTYDSRGTESVVYDMELYLKRLGPGAAAHSLAELTKLIGVDPVSDQGPLGWYAKPLPALAESRKHPEETPDLSAFAAVRQSYLRTINAVVAKHHLDAFAFPQMAAALPGIFNKDRYLSTTVSELNISGVPGVTVPAGRYKSGSPFSLIFVGPMWSEANLLGYAYDYEQATHHRIIPDLVTEPYKAAP